MDLYEEQSPVWQSRNYDRTTTTIVTFDPRVGSRITVRVLDDVVVLEACI